MAEKIKRTEYKVKSGFVGLVAWTSPPPFERSDGGKFVLGEKLTQKELAYLIEVVGYEGIEPVATE